MRHRSSFLAACAAAGLITGTAAAPALASGSVVAFGGYAAGTIVVRTNERRLYLVVDAQHALSYPVGVGKAGKQWQGTSHIDGKYVRPAWSPPAEVKRDNPRLPAVIQGGAPNNPMGARALTLDRSEIAIHGTSAAMRASVGSAASYGCIRMYNEDVVDLFDRVSVGTRVLAVR